MQRGLWAWGSGVGTMLLAVAAKEKGADVLQFWYVSGLAGVAAMFFKSVAADWDN